MNRKTTIALVVFALLLVVVFIVERQPQKGDRVGEPERPLQKIARHELEKVVIATKERTVELTNDGPDKGWRVTKPVVYPADKYATDTLVEKLTELEFGDLITERTDKHDELEVTKEKGVRVTVRRGETTIADFYLGKTEGDFTMFRLADKNEVWQAVGALRSAFDRELKDWRDRTITDFNQDDAVALTVKSPAGEVALTRKDGKSPWQVARTSAPIDQLDEGAVNNLLSSLYALSADDFADKVKPADAGLTPPAYRIEAQLRIVKEEKKEKEGGEAKDKKGGEAKDEKSGEAKDKKGKTKKVVVEKRVAVLVGKKDGDDYYVQLEGKPQIFKVTAYKMEPLLLRPVDFRDKTVLSFKADDAVKLTVTHVADGKKDTLTFTRKGKSWYLGKKKADPEDKVQAAVEALANLKADGFARRGAKELGLDRPAWRVAVTLKDRTRYEIVVGDKEKDGNVGLARKGRPDLFRISKYTMETIQLQRDTFK